MNEFHKYNFNKKRRSYTITAKIYMIQIPDPDASLSETLHPGISFVSDLMTFDFMN
jgi:hypothetical protein